MNGNDLRGIVLQPRDLRLLHELHHLRVTDREDARVIAGFRSRTRANTRLLRLVEAGLLARRAAGTVKGGHKFLYALSTRGARLIGKPYRAPMWNADTVLAWSPSLEHQLLVNRVYLALKNPPSGRQIRLAQWTTFARPISASIRLMPDAYARIETSDGTRALFLEVDRGTESLRVWKAKIAAYVDLAVTGEFATHFQLPQFRVAVLTPSVRRLGTIRACVTKYTDKLFWFSSFAADPTEWFWDRSWLRPRGVELHTLI